MELQLRAIEYGASEINIYRFAHPRGDVLPAASPGAHIDLHLRPHIRQYSLLQTGDRLREYVIAVRHEPAGRGASASLHKDSVVGAFYEISRPRNSFIGNALPDEVHLFAGGIGVTPLLAIYRDLRAAGRRVALYYWAGRREDFMFYDELKPDPAVHLFATREGKTVPVLADILASISRSAAICCCGPARMLEAFDAATGDRPAHLLHRERFNPVAVATDGSAFSVYLKRSDISLTIGPAETILQACLAAGVEVAYSCEEGVCGACIVPVLSGDVDHRDSVWPAQRHQQDSTMAICCSRAQRGALVLDI